MMKSYLLRSSFLLSFSALALFLSACGAPIRKADYRVGYRETGLASWYGEDFHGRPTSSGEIYNMFDLTAAHKTLPLGTLLKVTEFQGGRTVKVKVNDRGPFVGDRILDLSFGAAQALGMVEAGLAEIQLEIVGRAPVGRKRSGGEDRFLVQVGSYQIKENAMRMKEEVELHYQAVYIETYESRRETWHRVRIGPFRSERKAEAVARELHSRISIEEPIVPVVLRAN